MGRQSCAAWDSPTPRPFVKEGTDVIRARALGLVVIGVGLLVGLFMWIGPWVRLAGA